MSRKIVSLLVRLIVLAALAGGAWYGWTHWQKSQVKPLEDRVQIEEAARGPITQAVTANGTINPVVIVNVGTQVSGTVKVLHADFNSHVEKGEVLLELDPTLFRAAVEQSRGDLGVADAAFRLAQLNEQRIRQLYQQEYVTRQELDQAVQARDTAAAQRRIAQGRLARDEANLAFSVIRSPVSGIVVSRQVDIGQTVAASFQTPTLFQIAQDLKRMQINTNVAEADIGKIRTDMDVNFTVDAFPGRDFRGTIKQIRLNPIVEQNVVTYNAVVGVENDDLSLMPGMTAYISVVVETREDALIVPTAALRFKPRENGAGGAGGANGASGGTAERPNRPEGAGKPGKDRGPKVYVVRGEQMVPVPVKTGISDGKHVEIVGGELKAGDRVAVQYRAAGGSGAAGGRMRAF